MTLTPCRVAIFALLATAAVAVAQEDSEPRLARFAFDRDALVQWKLPDKLREISGLARSPDGRVFAHEDERAIVYEIDLERQKLAKAFALGDPTVKGDFEGIAVAHDRIWLVTSDGRLFEAQEGADGERVIYNSYQTGVARWCTLEGLAHDPQRDVLLLACKHVLAEPYRGDLTVFAWSLATRSLERAHTLRVPLSELRGRLGTQHLHPSGIEVDPETGHRFIIAARERAIVELSPSGQVLWALRFPLAKRHRQPEGITFTLDGRIAIADEGAGRKARIGLYAPRSAVRGVATP